MTNEEFIILAGKVADGTASIPEIALYNASYESFQQDPQSLTAEGLDATELKNESLTRFWKSVDVSGPVRKRLWPRIAAVSMTWKIAAAVAAITLGTWLYYFANTPRHPEFISGPPLANDIAPGKNTATLTLANGKTINLSDAKTGVIIHASSLSYNDGSKIGDSSLRGNEAISHMLTASTPRGGTYQVTLPDGTKVWLNADTKISFPSQFIGRERKVLLTNGEAYFEVVKNKKMPFIVESKGQQVDVLGTHFNIKAYANEGSTKTTLLEGSVSISSLLSSRGMAKDLGPTGPGTKNRQGPSRLGMTRGVGEAAILKPGQQSVLTGNTIKVKQVDPTEAIAWKNNKFIFESQQISEIMRMVERWYNVEVVYQQEIPQDRYSGTVSRFDNVSNVLRILEASGGVKFKIEGRRILVTK